MIGILPLLTALLLPRAACGQYQETGEKATAQFTNPKSATDDQTCMSRAQATQDMYEIIAHDFEKTRPFHKAQARDFRTYADLQPGQNVLDLGCGTGLVTIKAKRRVGPTGRVVGVDMSPFMLIQARRKAKRAGLDIVFLEHDVNNLDDQFNFLGSDFDVITCASTFLFLEDGAKALRNWARFLKPGGRIIFDIPDARQQLPYYVGHSILVESGRPTLTMEHKLGSAESMEGVILEAGLQPHVFKSRVYQRKSYFIIEGLQVLTDQLDSPFYACFRSPELFYQAARRFREEFVAKQDSRGVVTDAVWFWVGIATKPD